MVADQAATAYNVTWTRTTPVVVSCLDDAKNAYITGESSLRMGMDVNSTADNVWAFRFACSSAFSPIEYCVVGDSTGLSVTLGLGERILNGEIPELFYSNGYLVYKIQGKSDIFLLLDPVTGIVTDCALGINGVYCYHDQITNNQIFLAQNLTSTDPGVQPGWLDLIGGIVMGAAEADGAGSAVFIGGTGGEVAVGGATGVIGLTAIGTGIVYGGAVVGMSVAVAVLLYEPYFMLYGFPEKLRIMKEIYDMKKNQSEAWTGAVSLFLPKDREPTPEELQEANIKAASLLMSLYGGDQDYYYQAYSNLASIGRNILNGGYEDFDEDENKIIKIFLFQMAIDDSLESNGGAAGSDGNSTEWANAFLNTARFIKNQGTEMVNGIRAGDPIAFAKGGAGVTLGIG